MNQRIRQLALHAGMKECALGFGMPENVLWGDDQIKNFAELLVRECAELCTYPYNCGVDWHGDGSGITAADTRCSELIKKHFGVEE